MENELSTNEIMMGIQAQPAHSGAVEVEKSRAVQEVQAKLVIAKRFPRDPNAVYARVMDACKRKSLAEQAMYSYPRGGAVVTGPSIRMAEILAQNYGNLDFGVRELERRSNSSLAESYCWDLETNVTQTKVFEVPHEIDLKGGRKKKLTDVRDIYELVANNGARRMRACILGIIPGDLVEAAVAQCRKTVSAGGGEPMADRIRKMVVAFKDIGVSQEMLAERLGHGVELITGDEIVELTGIYTAIRDKQSKRGDFFNFKDEEGQDSKTAELAEKLKEQK